MSDNDKAPAWRVVTISNYNGDKKWCVHEGDRLAMWTGKHDDARRIVEAVNGAAEALRERDEARSELAALRGEANTVWRVGSAKTPDGVELWSVYEGDRLVMAAEDEAQARLVAGAPGCLRIANDLRARLGIALESREQVQRDRARLADECRRYQSERDELRAALDASRENVQHAQRRLGVLVEERTEARRERDDARDELAALRERATEQAPASTLTALVQAAERLTATVARHGELLGIAPEPGEIAKLRAVALAVADWLKAENSKPLGCGQCEEAYRVWRELQIEIAPALGLDEPHWPAVDAALRALAGGAR